MIFKVSFKINCSVIYGLLMHWPLAHIAVVSAGMQVLPAHPWGGQLWKVPQIVQL